MKFWFSIFCFVLVVYAGNPIRDCLNEQIIKQSKGTNYYKINRALQDTTQISIWGNSTAFMSFDAGMIEKKTQRSCYNYGIEGAFYNELIHLEYFNQNNTGKHIIWILNPFEFLRHQNSKINIIDHYLPFSNTNIEHHQLQKNGFSFLKYFGWNTIFRMNAEHWKLILGGKNKVNFDQHGNIQFEQDFKHKNAFYQDSLKYSLDKIKEINALIKSINKNNQLTLVIPPNLTHQDFNSFIKQITHPIIDFSNFFTDQSSFQDHIHIRPNKMGVLTTQLIRKL